MAPKQNTTDLFAGNNLVSKEKNKIPEVEKTANSENKGIHLKRYFTEQGTDPLDVLEYERRSSRITETSGEVVFELNNIEVPESWSQLATDIIASKYIRRAGVPKTGHETSAKQVVHRIAHTIRNFGDNQNYFSSLNCLF